MEATEAALAAAREGRLEPAADLLARGTLNDPRDFEERFFDVLDERGAREGIVDAPPRLPRRFKLALGLLRLVLVLSVAATVILVLLSVARH